MNINSKLLHCIHKIQLIPWLQYRMVHKLFCLFFSQTALWQRPSFNRSGDTDLQVNRPWRVFYLLKNIIEVFVAWCGRFFNHKYFIQFAIWIIWRNYGLRVNYNKHTIFLFCFMYKIIKNFFQGLYIYHLLKYQEVHEVLSTK